MVDFFNKLSTLATSQPLVSAAPLVLQAVAWDVVLDAFPLENGLLVRVSGLQSSDAPTVTLFSVGSQFSSTITLVQDNSQSDLYTGTFSFTDDTVEEGHLWLRGASASGTPLETVTTYAIGGAPGSYGRAYPPLDPASSDGNLELHIPNGAISDDAPVIVMPTRGLPALPQAVPVLGTPYSIRGPVGLAHLDERASLAMYYNTDAAVEIDLNDLHIYHYNETANCWEDLDGDLHKSRNLITTPIQKFGIYVIVVAEGGTCQNPLLQTLYLPSISAVQ